MRVVKVPTHLLLCVGFSMEPARLGLAPSRQQKAAIARDAVVLAEEQHNFAVQVAASVRSRLRCGARRTPRRLERPARVGAS